MSSLDTINKMHYIVDGCGNYYRINGKEQLVVADSREAAGIFSFVEANQRIGNGKKAHFYSAIPMDEEVSEMLYPDADKKDTPHTISHTLDTNSPAVTQENFASYDAEMKMTLPYDMKGIDWSEYLTHFCYLVSGIQNYQDELNQTLSHIDMQICDIMHYIELYNLDENDSLHMIELLKECREQRRDVKDEMVRVEYFQKAIGTSGNVAKAKDSIKQIKKLNTRTYHPRKLQGLFEECPEKTIRQSKLIRAFEKNTCMDILENEYKETCYIEQETEEEGVIMEYTKQNTIFDGKENHWEQFAKQQADFYANAEQYIYNLQTDIDEIDAEIEQVFNEIENANYNVAQGYKVFKHLKELRNAKKAKQKELECLYILTEQFDCKAMAEIMAECVSEIESISIEMRQEEKAVEIVLAG